MAKSRPTYLRPVLERMLAENPDRTERSALRFALHAVARLGDPGPEVAWLRGRNVELAKACKAAELDPAAVLASEACVLWSPEFGESRRLILFESSDDARDFLRETGGEMFLLDEITYQATRSEG